MKNIIAKKDYSPIINFMKQSIENTFWIYYKYFDENMKIKFEKYLKENGFNVKEVYQKRLEKYPETERDFPKEWNKVE